MKRLLWAMGVGLGVAACGTEPSGTLSVTVEALPPIVVDPNLSVRGTVTRSPASEAVVVVAVAGGLSTVTDTVTGGSFTVPVRLHPNEENQLAITASDETGSISDPVILVIFHDDVGPQISQVTPRSRERQVSLDTPIEALFEEALTPSSPNDGMTLLHNSRPVPGQSVLSGDMRTLSFVPDDPLEPGSTYQIGIQGFADEAGNPAGSGSDLCFVTTSEGFPTDTATEEPDQITLTAGTPDPSTLDAVDFRRMIFTRSGVRLYGLMEFATPRTFSNSGKTNASALIDIDLDQNPATGFTSVYDYLLRNIPELDSHLGAELLVGIEPREDFGDSAYVGVLTSDSTSFVVADLFGVGVCGTYFGFNTDSIIGAFGDDGNFDFTVLAIASSGPGAYADAAPESGFFQATLDGTSTSLLPGLAERLSHYLRKAVQGVVGDQRPFRRR